MTGILTRKTALQTSNHWTSACELLGRGVGGGAEGGSVRFMGALVSFKAGMELWCIGRAGDVEGFQVASYYNTYNVHILTSIEGSFLKLLSRSSMWPFYTYF